MWRLEGTNFSGWAGAILVVGLAASSCSPDEQVEVESAGSTVSEEYVAPRYVVPKQVEEAGVDAVGDSGPGVDASNWRIKPPFYAAGREPYWRLDLEDGWFVFQRLGLPAIETPAMAPIQTDGADVFEGDAFTMTLRPGPCNQALVDEKTEGSVEVNYEGVVLTGCVYAGASPAADASRDKGGWTQEVPVYIIEIDACLKALGERNNLDASTLVVTAVFPREEGTTGVVTRSDDGRLYECGVDSVGELQFADTINRATTADWMLEGDYFLRSDSEAPPEYCMDAEPVLVDGALLGYLVTEECRN